MLTWILWGILMAVLAVMIVRRFVNPKFLTDLNQEEFKKGYRKAQLIDVREPREYNGGHILGARNIPLSQLKQRVNEVRDDQPVYLYCQSGARSRQAARLIKKQRGTEDIYQLKKGFRKWTGKIKKK
ncbi:Rhodanese-related sulfurtransferase [Alteribacillus persepolensis]|uniref:Rhodanese-related sulfurtransferase n=1 Tax=Alteribacillus persepolensis TaxID=568899 RepID=A0A1G8CY99_9BACI|nr:rhodanese-like domain-containing protein [Alteribacillus persepolensis]SDH50314.1 Rhodanese-related sulfurtransferase [Alteribacillus persepolensis]